MKDYPPEFAEDFAILEARRVRVSPEIEQAAIRPGLDFAKALLGLAALLLFLSAILIHV